MRLTHDRKVVGSKLTLKLESLKNEINKSLTLQISFHRDTDGSTVSGAGFTDHVITLNRGAGGFGFRIIGGQEEKTQVWLLIYIYLTRSGHPL